MPRSLPSGRSTQPGESRRTDRPTGSTAARRYAVVCAVAALAYVLRPLPDAAHDAAFAVVGLGTSIAIFAAIGLHRPSRAWPWAALGVAAVVFLAGALVRPWAATQTGALTAAADAFTLPGYVVLVAALLGFLRVRRGIDVHAFTDGLTVSIGAALICWVLFAQPAAEVGGRARWISMIAAAYPVLDVVVLLLLLNLAFTTAVRYRSYRLLSGGLVLLFVGDLGYAYLGRTGDLSGDWQHDAPYLAAYSLFGIAALHPSMAELTRATPRPVQTWSGGRLALVTSSLAVPAVLMVLRPPDTAALRLTYALAMLAMVGALVARAVTAVHAYAHSEEGLRHQATHDALTDLLNREHLVEHVDSMLERTPAVALLFLDLDGFKLVNDNWGHRAGDGVLLEVSRRLRAAAGTGDVIARIGGDEFIVAGLIGGDTADDADELADRVRSVFDRPFVVAGAEVVITASIGVSVAASGDAAEAMIRDADTAMYRAKAGGRDRTVMFDTSMRETVRTRVELELALRHAVAREEFSLAYMPVVDLATERVLGYEALLRWNHPTLGAVSPGDFVPVAEDTGQIVGIGLWVLRAGAAQLARWYDENPRLLDGPDALTLSINVSARQLRDGGLVEAVTDVLAATRLPARSLCLEITESAILTDTDTAEQTLRQLAAIGVSISVDDFGTGYSSLGYLRRFPVHEVKIDRTFVAGLGRSCEDEEIVRAVTAMGHALGLAVVAEGVETVDQQEMLRHFGVDRGQGWLYGKALPAADIALPPGAVAAPPRHEPAVKLA